MFYSFTYHTQCRRPTDPLRPAKQKMSIVSLMGVKVLNNPAKFTDPYEFEITFECLEQLKDDLEWKLTYVGSSRSLEHDQELDSILVGPIPVGVNKFIMTADAPSPELIPASELVSVTVILLSCSYKEREFVRVGYYVNNEYDSEDLRENPPAKVQVDHIVRNILAEKPRVTRFNIMWDNENDLDEYPPEQPDDAEENEEEEDAIIDMGADADDDEGEDGDLEEEEGNIESAKRQNTINDDDIPEIKRQKLDENDEVDAGEEDLDELEEEDEEDLEEELEEELDEEEEEVEDIDADNERNNPQLAGKEDTTEVEQDPIQAETPKIESSAPTPTETPV